MRRMLLIPTIIGLCCCGQFRTVNAEQKNQTPSPPTRAPETALSGLDVADDLTVTLMASEPGLLSPSNIDVDHLGRIWVCEVVNYRKFANKDNRVREAGDRIAVLEDTNGNGIIDKDTTFYQGRDIDSAHGVCVLGNRVIVSAGANVFDFYDDDGDLKADRKEVLFAGIKGVQHDHGIHSFTFGIDGRLYFNFGNNGHELHDADGQIVIDHAGNEVIANRNPYQQGLAFRCELDGSGVDTLGWNFRNNWELCPDSYGTVWQSDNDDDGNRGVRINFVMEYGNYGYKDEFTGAGWRDYRTGWEDTIPERHWHLNDPGVVPNLLQTGAGSPTGILCYEGDLLPPRFHNQLIHCDAGPNIVRSYAVTNDGAGYKAEVNDILTGTRDQWFRPSDVCVAPDGSLIIADWYDPGVGGHRQGDTDRGRLFRVAPLKSEYVITKPDFTTVDGAVLALKNPNVATRYLAFQSLSKFGAAAEPALNAVFLSDQNSRFRARALWLLGQITKKTDSYVQRALKDSDNNIRITGLRLARRMNANLPKAIATVVNDTSPQVRRECAIALRRLPNAQKAEFWGMLAAQLPHNDRWYLEALGIAAEGAWDECLAAYSKEDNDAERYAALIWRSRGSNSATELARLIRKAAASEDGADQIGRYFRALDFQSEDAVASEMEEMLAIDAMQDVDSNLRQFLTIECLQRIDTSGLASDSNAAVALESVLKDVQGTAKFVELVQKFQLKDHHPTVLNLAQANPVNQIGVQAAQLLIKAKEWDLLNTALRQKDTKTAVATADVLGNTLEAMIEGIVLGIIADDSVHIEVRRACVRAAAKVPNAAKTLCHRYANQQLDSELTQTAAAALHSAGSEATRKLATKLFPLPPAKEGKPLPSLPQLVRLNSDLANGRLIFNTTGTCHKCHVVNKIGRDIGPDLSEIGSKLSRQAMFESIIYPSAGISHNYEAYTLVLATGTTITGLITSDTDDNISVKGDDGLVRTFPQSEVDEKVKQKISLMPSDLQKTMTVQEIVDVVGYMQSLKKK